MDTAKSQTEATATIPAVTSCPRMKFDNGGSRMNNLKVYFNEFMNTPMKNHKVCFKNSIQKMADKFGDITWSSKEGKNSESLAAASEEGTAQKVH